MSSHMQDGIVDTSSTWLQDIRLPPYVEHCTLSLVTPPTCIGYIWEYFVQKGNSVPPGVNLEIVFLYRYINRAFMNHQVDFNPVFIG